MMIENLPLRSQEMIDLLDSGCVALQIGPDADGPMRPNPSAWMVGGEFDITDSIDIDIGRRTLTHVRRVRKCTTHNPHTWRESISWRTMKVTREYYVESVSSDMIEDLKARFHPQRLTVHHLHKEPVGIGDFDWFSH